MVFLLLVVFSLFSGSVHAFTMLDTVTISTLKNDDSLIQMPYYHPEDQDTELMYGPDLMRFVNRQKEHPCNPGSLPFSRMKDPNQHPNFPQLPHNPVEGDYLGIDFFREKSTKIFLLEHWPENHFPLLTFHLTHESEKYRPWISETIENLNHMSQKSGIIKPTQNLIELSDETVDAEDESCDLHLIQVSNYETYGIMMVNESEFIKNVADRLGEMVDSDIVIYPKNIKDYHTVPLKKVFEETLTHELLHSIGVNHNFSLASVMDYDDKIYYQSMDQWLSEYEVDVLKYLYKDQSIHYKPWALRRNEDYWYNNVMTNVSDGMYKVAITNGRQICTDPEGKQNEKNLSGKYMYIQIKNDEFGASVTFDPKNNFRLPPGLEFNVAYKKDGSLTHLNSSTSSDFYRLDHSSAKFNLFLPTNFTFLQTNSPSNEFHIHWKHSKDVSENSDLIEACDVELQLHYADEMVKNSTPAIH